MKILHLIDSGGLYGAERMLLTLVGEQVARGLSPLILSVGESAADDKPLEVEARRLGLPVKAWRMAPGFNLRESWSIIRWARREQYQLMHSHGYKFNVLMGIWPEALRKIPLMTTLHGYVRASRFTKSWFYEALDRLVLGQMRQVVLVSEAIRFQIPGRIARSNRVSVVMNGLNTESVRHQATQSLGAELDDFLVNGHPVILGVGRLSPEKGFDRLIGAFRILLSHYPEAQLVIVGEGKQRDALEQQVAESKLSDHVCFPGYIEQVAALMKRTSVLCIPSLTEGLPITLLEAMSLGVPVVASDVGEISNVLGDQKGGIVFRYESPSALAEMLVAAIEDRNNTSARARWSEQRVEQAFSGHAMMEHYLKIYQQVLA
ncbi:glycoside hydrolase [Marinobacter similis]|uniref:Glycoside hydrolase n=2 Tax=Marinobacter similis TaxID=1420916 RepID=W5YF92_9GAMM|nr:glycoside hydrolase [Marinobacter similis]